MVRRGRLLPSGAVEAPLKMEGNRDKIRRLFDEVLNAGKLSLLDTLIGAAYVDHNPSPGQPAGAAGVKGKVEALRAAFPDLRYTLEDLVAEGELVAARYSWRGTHKGEAFLGIPPSGKSILVRGMDFYRLRDGRIVEHWDNIDELGMLTQLGDLG
jgi:steroid delta-isomerase-like uncharacterized protein